jgi:hypothetical protein
MFTVFVDGLMRCDPVDEVDQVGQKRDGGQVSRCFVGSGINLAHVHVLQRAAEWS